MTSWTGIGLMFVEDGMKKEAAQVFFAVDSARLGC
jgi:hypothetical protein